MSIRMKFGVVALALAFVTSAAVAADAAKPTRIRGVSCRSRAIR